MDTLKYVRMLKERNIAVYFEVEKINTLKDGEFLMTILSSVAQQEVENTSAYVKKGLKMKMKRGELVGFQGCLGYDYDIETKSISINEEGRQEKDNCCIAHDKSPNLYPIPQTVMTYLGDLGLSSILFLNLLIWTLTAFSSPRYASFQIREYICSLVYTFFGF